MHLIDIISNLSILAPTLLGAVLFTRLDGNLRLLYGLIVGTLVLEGVILYTSYNGIGNLYLFHVYTFLEFGVISVLYYRLMRMFLFRVILIVTALGFVVFSLLNLTYWESFSEFNSNQRAVEGVIVLFYLFYYAVYLMQTLELKNIEKHPYYWLTIAYVFYFLATFLLFTFSKSLIKENIQAYWFIHGAFNIFLNTMYAVVLWIGRKKQTS